MQYAGLAGLPSPLRWLALLLLPHLLPTQLAVAVACYDVVSGLIGC
jgi:hypothetical protein